MVGGLAGGRVGELAGALAVGFGKIGFDNFS